MASMLFRIKIRPINSYQIDENLIGNFVALVSLVNFQNKGLPHVHFIFFLEQSKNYLRRTEEIYEIISAEIASSQDT